MIKSAMEYFVSAVASLKPKQDNPHRDIFGRVIEHGEEFFHPQTFKGIPVFDTDSIMRHYKPLLEKLQLHTDIGSHRRTPDGKHNLFDALYTDIIRRYIEFAHMIPASEDHHHSHTGGLIVHSLEVSIASLRYAKEVEVPKTGFSDLDQQLKPIMHYCAWLAGLLHDAGKMMIDISVDAAEVLHPLTKRPIPLTTNITSWRPQKESLTTWALRNNVASYSVSFYNNRKHKRHNVDSAQIMKPLLDGTYALDYILESPLKNDTYSELCRVLSGYTMSKDYLSTAVRHGDADSTGRNIGIDYDRVRGTRVVSTASRIYQAIKNARREWDWNITNAEGWIIGGDVYLRWTSAIDSIIRVSQELQYLLPSDARNLLTIMESNGLVQVYDKANRMVKFCPGGYKAEDIPLIASGQRNIRWIDLFKMRGREMVFGADPMPDSVPGLLFLPETSVFIIIDKEGNSVHYDMDSLDSGEQSAVTQAAPSLPTKPVVQTQAPTEQQNTGKAAAPTKNSKAKKPKEPVKQQGEHAQVPDQSSTKPEAAPAKTLQLLPRETTLSNDEAVNIMFKNDFSESGREATTNAHNQKTGNNMPAQKEPIALIEQSESGVASEQDIPNTSTNEKPTQLANVNTKPKRCSPVLSQLLDEKVKYHADGKKRLIDSEDAQRITQLGIKEIISDLEKGSHLAINLMNPNQKIETLTVDGQAVKAIPVAPALNAYFTYSFMSAENDSGKKDIGSEEDSTSSSQLDIFNAEPASKNDNVSPLFSRREINIPAGQTPAKSVDDATEISPKMTAKQQAAAIIEEILSSDARFFVLSGHPHIDVVSASRAIGTTPEQLVSRLHGAKMLHIDVAGTDQSYTKSISHDGNTYTVTVLKKHFAKYFSKLEVHHESKGQSSEAATHPEDTQSTVSSEYSTDYIIGNAAEGTLAKFLSKFPEANETFFIADAEHIKVNTLAIIKVMTARKADFPFGLSALKKVIRKYSVNTEEHGDITYACIPNAQFKTIQLSEI